MTENPSSFSSPVNSRETPLSFEPHSACTRKQDVNSEIMVPKLRVFRPFEDVWVLKTGTHEGANNE